MSALWIAFLLILYLFVIGLLGGIVSLVASQFLSVTSNYVLYTLQLFGYKLDTCPVKGSVQLCPPGLSTRDCPDHYDCYLPCPSSLALQWFQVPDSPYGGQAYCEVFPRQLASNYSSLNSSQVQFWAQVGKAVIPVISGGSPSYDNIYIGMLSVFDMVTLDNYDLNFKLLSSNTGKAWLSALFVIPTTLFGAFVILNLFLAMLLSNLEHMDLALGSISLRESMSLKRMLPLATNQIAPEPTTVPQPDSSRPSVEQDFHHNHHHTLGRRSNSKHKSLAKISVELSASHTFGNTDDLVLQRLPGLCDKLEGNSLGMLSPTNSLRIWLFSLLRRQGVNWFMNSIVILSCIELCFEDVAVEAGSIKAKVLQGFNIAFFVIFGLEASHQSLADLALVPTFYTHSYLSHSLLPFSGISEDHGSWLLAQWQGQLLEEWLERPRFIHCRHQRHCHNPRASLDQYTVYPLASSSQVSPCPPSHSYRDAD